MNILILTNNADGLYKFRAELITELARRYDVTISAPRDDFSDRLAALGAKIIDTEFSRRGKNPFRDLQLMKTYEKLIREVKPDAVLTYTIKPNVYGGLACQKTKTPYLANVTGLGTAVENGGPLAALTTTLYKMGLKKASCVFFQNEANKKLFEEKKLYRGHARLIPGSGVNVDHYQVLEYPDGDTVDFIFVARVRKEKGIDSYLEAAKYIRQKYPYTRFHVCGACEEDYGTILHDLDQEGVILYHGNVSDMREIQKISCCTIHPSYYPEGMSNVLLESCASARPIITTDRPGCGEIVEDGVNGFVVKAKDSGDLIRVIENFLSLSREERKRMGEAGRKKVEAEFDRNVVIGAYLEEIEAIINAK